MAYKVPLGVNIQVTEEDKAWRSARRSFSQPGPRDVHLFTHLPLAGRQSHDHIQLQGLLGNVVQLCARKKTVFSEELTRFATEEQSI